MGALTTQLFLAGNAILKHITLSRTGLAPIELWPIWELDKIQVVPSQDNFIDHYDFRRDGAPYTLYPDEITHLLFEDPGNPFWGLSPLQAGARTVDTDVEATRWNKLLLQNRAMADFVFVMPSVNNQEDFELARQQVREQYSGADNARLPWVLGGSGTVEKLSMTPAELDYLESRKFTVEEIGALFGVPVPLIMAKDVTFANMDTARKLFWEDTVIPFLDGVKDTLNHALTPHFGATDEIELRYDTANVPAMRENLTDKVNQFKGLTSAGVPVNVAAQRLELGIDEIEGGDVGLVPATMVPLTEAGSMDEPENPRDPNQQTGPLNGKPKPEPNASDKDPESKP
jgi:HK97 family phage portal protein